jgi:hypothetical protein
VENVTGGKIMNTKSCFILIGLSAIILSWAYFASRNVVGDKTKNELSRTLFMPELRKSIDNIGTVTILSKGKSFKINVQNGKWVMPNKYYYAVDAEKIRDLVQNSARIQIIEEKTSSPENFASLGLDDPEKESSNAIRIILQNADESVTYADYIRGINRKGVIDSSERNEIYARLFNSNQTYLVQGVLNFDLGAHTLLSGETFSLKAESIQKINFNYLHSPQDNFTIGKNIPGQLDFEITEPSGMKIKAFGKVNAISTSLEYIKLADIMPKELFPETEPYVVVNYTTFSGLVMQVNLFKVEDESWLTFNASTDANDKQVTGDATRINTLAADWIYKVDPKSTGGFYYKLEDMVKD